jgi:hypothetical protein
MKRVTFYEDGLEVTSYGNGTAYAVYNTVTGNELFVQGDDAMLFRTEVLEAPDPIRAYKEHEWDTLETRTD